MSEYELAYQLLDACRILLRYDGINKERTRDAVDEIREIVNEWLHLKESGELDDE